MMDKGLINLILSPNPVPSPRATRGRDKRNTSWSTTQCCCGEGVVSLNLTKMKCVHLLLWCCRMMKDQVSFFPLSSALFLFHLFFMKFNFIIIFASHPLAVLIYFILSTSISCPIVSVATPAPAFHHIRDTWFPHNPCN